MEYVLNVLNDDLVLHDLSSTGRERPWKAKKEANGLLCRLYKSLSEEPEDYYDLKASRLRECATWLTFDKLEDTLKLANMCSCRVRLCPMCAWRRTLKISSHARKIFEYLETEYLGKYTYLFLTLTIPNCKDNELSTTIDILMSAFKRFIDRKEVKSIVKGWYRGLEITHNHNVNSKSYDTYHPHYHIILVVDKSYLDQRKSDRGYITIERWKMLWAESLGYFIPRVSITQDIFVSKFLDCFNRNLVNGKNSFSYKVSKKSNVVAKIKCSSYPDDNSRFSLACSLWDRYVKSLYRPCKPKTAYVSLSSVETFDKIRSVCHNEFLCHAEREIFVKSIGKNKKRVFKSGVHPVDWLKYHDFDYLQFITAKRLMLQVNVQSVKPKYKHINSDDPLECSGLIGAICETVKYTVKDKSYILPYDWDLSKDIVYTLDMALADRRLIAWGGVLAKIHKLLNLDDEVDGDLIHIDDNSTLDDSKSQVTYFWNVGYQQYIQGDFNVDNN